MTEDAPEPQSAQGMAMPAIPGYRVLRELGRGGMATVYLAVQESLGREVALKLLTRRLADDPSAAERFVREARTAARLVHRHIVGVHDVGEHAGQPFLAMEYLPGDTIAGGALPPTQALEIAREIALALDHAHRQGVVHRDIKPENILRRADGSCALADFGIARTADGGGGMTQDGITLGTPHYMSPEQLQGGELDGRSDLYSLGVVLYQLLTGDVPYKGTDGWAVGMQHISAPLPHLPPPLARYQPVIDALMAKDPARRPQTGADAARVIEAAMGRSGSTPTLAMRGVAGPRASMHRRTLGFAAAGLVVLVLLGGWLYARRGASSGAEPPAPAAQVAAEPARSIAVLPLVNLSGNPANDYFSDGLAETTLDMLARVPDLKVIARSSSFAFKGKSEDVREIGRKLGAANLLEGSVQQAGDEVRISMQLIRASDGSHLWARTYDRKLADVFHIQDEVAGEVVKALQMALPGAQKSRMDDMRSTNIDAYREYLRGTALLPDRRADQMREAAAHFEKAIAIDPAYARAYVSASLAYLLLDQYSSITGDERERVQRYTDRALQLAPDLGEAHIARGGLFERAGRWDDAVKEYRRGVELAPGYATGHQWLGEILQFWYGQSAEAMHEIDLARALDPLSPVIGNVRAFALLAQDRVDEARAAVDAMIAEAPGLARNYDTRAAVHMQRGDMVAALRDGLAFQRLDPKSYGYQTHHCMALLQFNALAAASQCAERLGRAAPQSPDVAVVRARVALVQGKPELAERVLAGTSFPVLVANARLARGDADGALALLRSNSPELFTEAPAIVVGNAPDALSAGTALLRTGDRVRGTRLVQASLSAEKGQPRGAAQLGRSWNDVVAYARLGDLDAAIAALKDGVQSGFFLDLDALDADPSLAALRADPRFEQTLAPARAHARAQIAAARAAGLLSPIQ